MNEYLALLKKLIEIKSYSGQEDELRNFIKDWFSNNNIKSFTQEKNLIVHFEGMDHKRAFMFNSHMDTVSQGDGQWKYSPTSPTIEGEKLIGLGSSDMKIGLATSMLLTKQFVSNKPAIDIWFAYVTEEEYDGAGTKKFASWFEKKGYTKKYKEMAGIFTEPTNLTEIEYGHRGNIFLKALSRGDSGHASKPDKIRVHAVRKMVQFADVLNQEFAKWKGEYPVTNFDPPTLGEFTSIQAGVASKNGSIEVESPNKFPSVCIATFDLRTTPTFHEVAFKKIQQLGKKAGVEISLAFPAGPAGYTNPNDKIVKIAKKIVPNARLTVSKGSADLGFLSRIGVKAIIFGPGEKDEAHQIDEFCFPHQIPQALEIYKQIVETWAGHP